MEEFSILKEMEFESRLETASTWDQVRMLANLYGFPSPIFNEYDEVVVPE